MSIVQELGDKLAGLQPAECRDLLAYLKSKYGFEPIAGPSKAVQNETEPVTEEPTIFDIVVSSVDPAKKVGVIKIVRTITNLGLKECKDIVDNLPKTIKEALPKADAEKLKEELEANGAKVELK